MDYFKEVEKLESQAYELSKNYAELYFQKEYVDKQDNKLDLEIENLNKIKNPVDEKLKELKVSIVHASELNFQLMGRVMSDIVTVFEGERYEFYSSYVNVFKGNEECYETMYFIAPCAMNKSGLTWDFLVESKDILILHNFRNKKLIRFVDFMINRKIHGLDYGRFDYLDDFIKYVINYKLNNSVDVNFDNIEEIKYKFLESKAEEINDRKAEREKKLTLN